MEISWAVIEVVNLRGVDINQMFPLPLSEDLRPLAEKRFCFGVQTSLDVGRKRAPDSIDGMDIFVILVVGIFLPPKKHSPTEQLEFL